jgi:hypothetical protein
MAFLAVPVLADGWKSLAFEISPDAENGKHLAFYSFAGRKIREHFRLLFVRNVELKPCGSF